MVRRVCTLCNNKIEVMIMRIYHVYLEQCINMFTAYVTYTRADVVDGNLTSLNVYTTFPT